MERIKCCFSCTSLFSNILAILITLKINCGKSIPKYYGQIKSHLEIP